MRCSAGRACSGAAVSSSADRPAPVRRRSRQISPTPPADAGRPCCSSASRSPSSRSIATWPQSDWTCLAGWTGVAALPLRAADHPRVGGPPRRDAANDPRTTPDDGGDRSGEQSGPGCNSVRVSAMLMRQVYCLKSAGITAVMTVLSGEGWLEQSITNISSLVDTFIEVVILSAFGERNRGLYVLKSRGMSHSNQIREFLLSDRGVDVIPVVIGPEGVLTVSARVTAESPVPVNPPSGPMTTGITST